MSIQAVTHHRLSRFYDDKPAELFLQKQLPNTSTNYESLLTQLKKLFHAKPGKQYGRFHSDLSQNPLHGWLKSCYEEKITFLNLSHHFMKNLKILLDDQKQELDGHFFFFLDKREEREHVYLFFLESESVTRISDNLELNQTEALNLSKLDFAIHIDIETWKTTEAGAAATYITQIRGRSTARTGDILSTAAGFESCVDIKQDTNSLLQALEYYSLKEEQDLANQYRQKAYEFCKDRQEIGEPVTIARLSRFMDEKQPDKFQTYVAHEKDIELKAPLHPDARQLKQLVRFSGKGKGLSLSFSSDLIQSSVQYDVQKQTLTLLDLPSSLKRQLAQHFKEE